MQDKLFYSVDELVALAPISRNRIYKGIQTNELASLKVGRRRLVSREAFASFIKRSARKGGAHGRS